MRIALLIFIAALFLDSCKTKKAIDPPPIQEIAEIADPITHQNRPLGKEIVFGKVIYDDSLSTDLVAIKLTVNDSICVNTYGDFEGFFSVNYNPSLMNENSYFEFVFRNYTLKKIPFINFPKDGNVFLDKKGELVTYNEYRTFYEKIRSCTR